MKVLITDSNAYYRKLITQLLSELPEVGEIQTATTAMECLQKHAEFTPDLITLDLNLTEISGYEVLRKLKELKSPTSVVIISQPGAPLIGEMFKSLEGGALDFIVKPTTQDDSGTASLKKWLTRIVQTVQFKKEIQKELSLAKNLSAESLSPRLPVPGSRKIQLVALGISTGGPSTLSQMLPLIKRKPQFPIVIVQHMPAVFTKVLAETLSSKCFFPVTEAMDNEILQKGHAYIAPGAKQTAIFSDSKHPGQLRFRITDDPPVNNCKPSVDYFLISVAKTLGANAAGIIMTGMGDDGAKGLLAMKDAGAATFAQDAATSIVFGMPHVAIEIGAANQTLSLAEISEQILMWCE